MSTCLKNINNKKLYEIYSNSDDIDKFSVGYIVANDGLYVVVEELDPYGNFNGWCCFCVKDIIQYKTNSKYLKCIEQLFRFNGNERKSIFLEDINDVLCSMITYIQKTKMVCAFELCNSQRQDCIGHIIEFDKTTKKVVVEIIDDYGYKDGVAIIDFAMISCIEFASLDTRKIDILYSLNN